MTLFFTADTHFGDHRTINIHRRPFADVASLLAQLNGVKHLVRGNNDGPGTGNAAGWASVQARSAQARSGGRRSRSTAGRPCPTDRTEPPK
jgi:calcineurin-like phosphoesterase family protein